MLGVRPGVRWKARCETLLWSGRFILSGGFRNAYSRMHVGKSISRALLAELIARQSFGGGCQGSNLSSRI